MGSVGSDSESGSATVPYESDDGATAVRASIPAIEAYYADNGTYKGVTLALLQAKYDAGIRDIEVVKANDRTYCIQSTTPGFPWYKAGPTEDIRPGECGMQKLDELPPPQTDAEMCIESTVSGETYYQVGPNGKAYPGRCP